MVIKAVRYGCGEDPDGYIVEMTEGVRAEPLRKVILSVLDLDETVAFYTDKLGMKLHRRRANINSKPKHASICSFVSFEISEDEGTMLELVYNYATERLNMGTGFMQLVLKAPPAAAAAAAAAAAKGTPFQDPNAYSVVLV